MEAANRVKEGPESPRRANNKPGRRFVKRETDTQKPELSPAEKTLSNQGVHLSAWGWLLSLLKRRKSVNTPRRGAGCSRPVTPHTQPAPCTSVTGLGQIRTVLPSRVNLPASCPGVVLGFTAGRPEKSTHVRWTEKHPKSQQPFSGRLVTVVLSRQY